MAFPMLGRECRRPSIGRPVRITQVWVYSRYVGPGVYPTARMCVWNRYLSRVPCIAGRI